MKLAHGWHFPDHEQHLQGMLEHPKHRMHLNGRLAYQGHKLLAAVERCKQRRLAVDVGGHVGLWSFNLAQMFDQVEAFEPVADHRECFVQNTLGLQNINLHAMALGAEAGFVSMDTEFGSSGNTTVRGIGDIAMRTLDSLGFREVDFIKIDCEGYEENVLRGAKDTILDSRPVIIVEQKRDHAERFGLQRLGAVEFLTDMGYKVVREISGDFVMEPA